MRGLSRWRRCAASTWCALALITGACPAALATPANLTPAAHCTRPAASSAGADDFNAVVQRNGPAVVQVVVLRGSRDPLDEAMGFEFFQPLQGLPLPGGEALERTFSSGFIIDPDGWILASAHAVFDAHEIWIYTADGRRLRARVHGLDRRYDVALLRVQASGLPVVAMKRSPPICPGAWLAAIGTPFGFERTVTVGVVSAYPRYLYGSSVPLIQTDVALNPGSSGGPLFNAEGDLVGMASMIYSASGIYIGVSFALPRDEVVRVATALREQDRLLEGGIGMHTQPVTADLARAFGLTAASGALVIRVDPGSPARLAGLLSGDIILGVAGGDRMDHAAIERRVRAAGVGTELDLEVWRNDAPRRVRVKVAQAAGEETMRMPESSDEPEVRLGLGLTTASGSMPDGLYVDSATGSALLAGLERGDRIVAINGRAVNTPEEFDGVLASLATRDVLALLVVRGGTAVYVPVSRRRGLRD